MEGQHNIEEDRGLADWLTYIANITTQVRFETTDRVGFLAACERLLIITDADTFMRIYYDGAQ